MSKNICSQHHCNSNLATCFFDLKFDFGFFYDFLEEFCINCSLSAFNRCEIDWRNTAGQKELARKPQKAGQHDDFYGGMLHVPTVFSVYFSNIFSLKPYSW